MNRRQKVVVLGALMMFHALPAAAYIDPGTGSALFYVVSGVIASAYFVVRGAWYRVIDLVFGLRRRDQRCGLAIHCEDPRYESTFIPVIRALSRRGLEVTFFTMYARGESFDALPAGTTHRAIPAGMLGYAYLNNIEAVVLATTTPQLDVMTFRRSRRVRHYAILQHALGECRYVRPYGYDYYDTVLCCGPIVKANIRKMESIRNSRAKDLLETGLPHYETLIAEAHAAPPLDDTRPLVLIAPSWGPLSMFEDLGIGFIHDVAARYQVIVRPHPQMRVSQPELYARILSMTNVEVNTDRTPAVAMSRAHVLLSDISGITQEFAFIHQRPVLVIDRASALGGLEGELLGGDSEVKGRCSQFVVPISPGEIGNISAHIARVLKNHSADHITRVRDEIVFNFGHASDVAAQQLHEIYERELPLGSKSQPRKQLQMTSDQRASPA